MYLKRWITGLIALPFLVFPIVLGEIYFTLLVGIAVFFAMWEYGRIVTEIKPKQFSFIPLFGMIIGLMIIAASHFNSFPTIVFLLAGNVLLVGFFSTIEYKDNPVVLETVKKQIQGIIYIPLLACFLVLIRNSSGGMVWIFFVLCVIFAGDTAALYVGSLWGKHKLNPAVSPGKTIEGSLGGLSANVLVGSAFITFFLPGLSWPIGILFFIIIGLAGQVGDLFESAMKRSSKIKDSSGLLPGHGGFMDRIDALLFAAPIAYLFKEFIF